MIAQKPPIPGESHAYFWVPPPHNKLVELPLSVGRRQGWTMDGDPWTPDQDEERDGECNCRGVSLVYWCRLIWYGEPWPLRLRIRLRWPPVYALQLPGCGCVKFFKDLLRDFRKFRHRHEATTAWVLRREAARAWIFQDGTTKPPTPSADGNPSDGSHPRGTDSRPTTRRAQGGVVAP